jgi:2,4-dienoyl-CoA reductase-like NADH-dependent reductase (Old Yellow Enzyme family)
MAQSGDNETSGTQLGSKQQLFQQAARNCAGAGFDGI